MSILKNKFKDIEKSVLKFVRLINTIEENIYDSDESIEREILINLNMTKKGARNLFKKFYPLDISLCKYINERKRSLVLWEVENINDNALIEMTIKRITHSSMKYFNDELYKDYGVRISDTKKNKNIKLNLLEAFDTNILKENIIDVSNSLDYMSKAGYIDIHRTKFRINKIDKYK